MHVVRGDTIESYKILQRLKLSIRIQLVNVKAHSGIPGNEMADQYSKDLARKILRRERL